MKTKKISEASLADVKQALRVDTEEDDEYLEGIMGNAVAYIVKQTGLTEEKVMDDASLYYPFLCVCQYMYDERCYTVSKNELNPMAKAAIYAVAENYL